MVKKMILSTALIILAIFLGIFLSYQYTLSRPPAPPRAEAADELSSLPSVTHPEGPAQKPSSPEEKPEEAPPKEPEAPAPQNGYYLRDHNGRIAIFAAGSETPEMIFDVYTRILPKPDQERLREGVYVKDYEALSRLVEDYIS